MLTKLKQKIDSIVNKEQSSSRLALAFCVGNYIAFSPFLGFHNLMIVAFSWLSGLNFIIMFAAANGINNLLTAIPIYAADYIFGYWFTHTLFNFNLNFLNPWWLDHFHVTCQSKLGFSMPCIWSFLIGGNILGIITSIALYPVIFYFFNHIKTNKTNNENNSSK